MSDLLEDIVIQLVLLKQFNIVLQNHRLHSCVDTTVFFFQLSVKYILLFNYYFKYLSLISFFCSLFNKYSEI